MATGATGQLGLALPVQGELSGTWGDTVNNGITQYTNIAIAGTLTLTGDGAVTLANTTGDASASNIVSTLTGAGTVTAQFAIVRVTGTLTVAKVVTGPSYSKTYAVVNAATGGIVTFKASGQTGVSVAAGESAFVYFNGTDYVKIVGTATAGAAGGSTTQVQYNNAGVLAGITGATTNGTALTLVAPNLGSPASVGTMPAFTLGGTVSGGGNQINNVIIGTTTPLAGAFTTLTASSTLTVTGAGSIEGLTVGRGAGAVSVNTAVGSGALATNASSQWMTAIGYQALNLATAGPNLGVGYQALVANTTGANNDAIGSYRALYSNTTGSSNVAIGREALQANTTASNNTAVGFQAAYASNVSSDSFGFQAHYQLTSGASNAAFGLSAGYNITTGARNTSIGNSAGPNSGTALTGSDNTAVGNQALTLSRGAAASNTAIGSQALYSNTTASSNTAVGYQAAYTNTTGIQNTALGMQALYFNTTGGSNTATGWNAMVANTTGDRNTANGYQALAVNTTGANNSAIGQQALYSNTTASNNTAVGYQAGYTNTTGNAVTFIGNKAGYSNTTGGQPVFVGHEAGYANTTGAQNVAMGDRALTANTTGGSNTALGGQSLFSNTTASNNTAVGYQAGYSNTTGAELVAIGRNALLGNTTGSSSTAVGYAALQIASTASNNTAVGYQAGYSASTSGYNAIFGTGAGFNLTTGATAWNTLIGSTAGRNLTTGAGNSFVGGSSSRQSGAGFYVTTGNANSILGGYDGNQGGLDIRTASNYIVLSDGDGNPRGVFDGSGNFLVGRTATWSGAGDNTVGIATVSSAGQLVVNATGGVNAFVVNNVNTDNSIISIRQANTEEGSISISGTTVSYNGGHLSRWAQTTTTKDESIVKGTVLSNLDAMNVYTDAEGNPVANEQLNKVKVSDTEGDVNVAGVFVNWSHDEAHNVDEINMAMTGDMIIRIAQGTTVVRGDLLMSAGDGTAKPQGDDIIRSKTVAKVTSNHVTCTYADGSYCVPCVLMAC